MVGGAYLILLCIGADIYTDLFAAGNSAYKDGELAVAVAAYEELVASGAANPELFYNLGCAYYHLEERGHAVLNFERAAALDAGFGAAFRALAVVDAERGDAGERPEGFALDGGGGSWFVGPAGAQGAFGVAMWWLLWGILVFRQVRSRGRWKKAAAVVWGLLAVGTIVTLLPESQRRAAVVIVPDTPVRFGPSVQDGLRMAIAPGERLVVDRVIQSWARVELADGRRGWVEENAIAYLGPPFASRRIERETPDE